MGDELDLDDVTALGWAVTAGSPAGLVVATRLRQGGGALGVDELSAIRQEWEAVGRPPYEPHVHRDVVGLADGTPVTAVSFTGDPYDRKAAPTYGVYLDPRWKPPWPHEHVDWPDFGVPADREELLEALHRLLARARSGDVVEVGCAGGHGRTGGSEAIE